MMLLSLYRFAILSSLIGTSVTYAADITQTVIHIHGTILGPTCTIKNKDLLVKFGTLTNKDLLFNQRSPSQDVIIEFSDCQIDDNSAAITFMGEESFYSDLQGLLAIDGDVASAPAGFAIRLTYLDGTPLPVNQESTTFNIENNRSIHLKAFVQTSQDAINSRKIRLGEFYATANFLVEYQ